VKPSSDVPILEVRQSLPIFGKDVTTKKVKGVMKTKE